MSTQQKLIFDIETVGADFDSLDVGQLFKEKKFVDIAKYNVGDPRATRELYDRWEKYLNF